MENKPLFGTVAHTGKTFTIHYHKNGNCSGINKTGFSRSVFNEIKVGSGFPIVRFDMASLKNVLESIRGEVDEIEEYYNMTPWSKPISLEQYLNKMEHTHNIPIEFI